MPDIIVIKDKRFSLLHTLNTNLDLINKVHTETIKELITKPKGHFLPQ
jgi:ADP-dependent phosphofructokinase/glucokinase